MNIDSKLVRELAELLGETGLSEIEVEDGDRKIRVARTISAAPVASVAVPAAPAPVAAPSAAPAAPAAPAEPAAPSMANAVKSPMVGTSYLAPEPGAAPFVSIGATVKIGDPLLIIEAMKVMNPIPAHRSGTVRQILIGSGDPLEFGQPIMVID